MAGCSATNTADGGGEEMTFYVGTYTRGGSRGIYRVSMNQDTGAIHVRNSYGGVDNPSFLAIDRGNRFLFAVSETGQYNGIQGGSVASFAIDPASGDLTKLSQQPSRGAAPAHLSVDSETRIVLVANYNGGNVALLPVDEAGMLSAPAAVRQHTGSSINPQRQERPHAHSIYLDPTERFAVAADLGIDRLMIYRVDAEQNALQLSDPPSFALAPGSGPRHMAFHPNGRRAYVINELSSTITACTYDQGSGTFTEIGTVSTLPDGFNGQNTCAEVRVAPSGDFVYGSNRGHDSIAVFAVDGSTGALTPVQHQSTDGRTPRNFEIAPTGRFLIAANQDTNNLVVFAIDPESGRLEETGHTATIPVPVCVRFARG